MLVCICVSVTSSTLIPVVVLALERQKKGEGPARKLFSVDELEWFSRNAYNLALKNTAVWELRCVVKMLTACVNIIGHFPPDIGSKVELSLKLLFSHFVIASALVALARAHDNVEKQRQDYTAMRKHIMAFDNELPEYLPQLDERSRDDMLRKHATLLAFDFEAAVALKLWDDLGSVVQRAVPCRNITSFQAMADSLLRAQAPGQGTSSVPTPWLSQVADGSPSSVFHHAQDRQRDLGPGQFRRHQAGQIHALPVPGHAAAGRRAGDEATG